MKQTITGIAIAGALVTYKVLLFLALKKEMEKERKKDVVDLEKVKEYKDFLK